MKLFSYLDLINRWLTRAVKTNSRPSGPFCLLLGQITYHKIFCLVTFTQSFDNVTLLKFWLVFTSQVQKHLGTHYFLGLAKVVMPRGNRSFLFKISHLEIGFLKMGSKKIFFRLVGFQIHEYGFADLSFIAKVIVSCYTKIPKWKLLTMWS